MGRKKYTGLYAQMSLPHESWQELSMDFALGLPKTFRVHDYILVVVDFYCKIAHFIPSSRTFDAFHMLNSFLRMFIFRIA